MPKPVRQVDIARKLGISRRAVGYALSGDPALQAKLGAKTRARVLRLAKESGYRAHRFARILSGGKTGLIGVISQISGITTGVERQFFAAQAIHAAGYEIFAFELWWKMDQFRRATDMMLDARVEGLLLVGLPVPDCRELRRFRDANVPIVSAGHIDVPFVPWVSTDYAQGVAALTQHLIRGGRRRLAYLTPWPQALIAKTAAFKARVAGFKRTAARAGLIGSNAAIVIEPPPSPVRFLDSHAIGKLGMARILKRRKRPDAVLCSNDNVALGALATCAEAGMRVPDDIAVTGFDNTPLAEYTMPALTSVAQPIEAVSTKAVKLLVNMIRSGKMAGQHARIELPCTLVVRQSSGGK